VGLQFLKSGGGIDREYDEAKETGFKVQEHLEGGGGNAKNVVGGRQRGEGERKIAGNRNIQEVDSNVTVTHPSAK